MKSSPKGRRVYTADSVIVEVCTKSSLTGSHRCILKFTRLLRMKVSRKCKVSIQETKRIAFLVTGLAEEGKYIEKKGEDSKLKQP
ncbi:hypothetical protein T4A_2615 [Trichinella pseudospiralis]|uniref:Uncharacterized protein n=1 Tax=Trichinella pseudospiralis TaxID=6337 RepID=A0A0V1DS78_TRIPS|nr:hypothetical protein T4A_2615 [Trichinella pseudospiralis]